MNLVGPSNLRRLMGFAVAATSFGLAACSPQLSGDLGDLQQLASRCPTDRKVATYVALDASDTVRSGVVKAAQLDAVRAEATATAVCGGRLRVVLFTSSAAATSVRFDAGLDPAGATEPARLRRVPEMVDHAMGEVTNGFDTAVAELPGDGTDVLAQLALAREFAGQLGGGFALRVVVLTDGVATRGVAITNSSDFNAAAAADLGARVPVPDLEGATVTIAGLGKVNGPPPPSEYIANLKVFYSTVCTRSRAAECRVVTDYTAPRSTP